jgi:hypothetical protein
MTCNDAMLGIIHCIFEPFRRKQATTGDINAAIKQVFASKLLQADSSLRPMVTMTWVPRIPAQFDRGKFVTAIEKCGIKGRIILLFHEVGGN